MSVDLATIGVEFQTDRLRQGQIELDKTAQAAGRTADAADKVGAASDRAGASARSAGGSFSTLSGIIGGLGLTAMAQQFFQVADAMSGVESKLRLVSRSADDLTNTQRRLFDIANQSRVSYTELGNTYAQVARSTQSLGVTGDRLLNVTKSISQAITISGGSAQGASAALVQLSQGFASGTLRGEELNSVMEQTPRLAQAIAEGLGITTGQLRALGQEGQITAEKVVTALEKSASSLEREFAQVTTTAGQAFTVLSNRAGRLVAELDRASNATSILSRLLDGAGTAIDQVASDLEKMRIQKPLREAAQEVIKLEAEATKLRNGMATGFFGPAFQANLDETLAKLQVAKQRFRELDRNGGQQEDNGIAAAQALIDNFTRKYDETAAKATATIRQLRGVSKDYEGDLRTLKAALDQGSLDIDTYREAVSNLAKENYKVSDSQKQSEESAKKNAEAYKDLRRSISDRIAQASAELANNGKLSDSASIRLKLDADLAAGTIRLTAARKALVLADIERLASIERLTEAEANAVANGRLQAEINMQLARTSEQSAQQLGDQNKQLREEIELIGTTSQQQVSILAARNEITIATKEATLAELERQSAITGTQTRQEIALAEEISQLRERNALLANKADRVEAAQLYDKLATEGKRFAQDLERGLTDSLFRAFESGKGFFKTLWDGIKNLFKTTVLKAIIQPAVGGITSALGFSSLANAATGGGGGGGGTELLTNSLFSQGVQSLAGGITVAGSSLAAIGSSVATGIQAGFTGANLSGAVAAYSAAGQTGVATGLSAGSSIGSAAAAAGPYVLAAVVALNALGVFRSNKIVDGGLAGTLGGQVNDYALNRRGGSLFSGPEYSVIDRGLSAQNDALQRAYSAMRTAVSGMADQLGVGNDAIKNFTVRLGDDLIHPDTGGYGIKTQGLTQDQIVKKIEEALASANEKMAEFVLGTKQYTKDGETATQTLVRLSERSRVVNSVLGDLGMTMFEASLAGGDMASKLTDSFGGLEALNSSVGAYYQAYYTEQERRVRREQVFSERLADLVDSGVLNDSLSELAVFNGDRSLANFRALVEAQDLTTEAGRTAFASLVNLSGVLASVSDAADKSIESLRGLAETYATSNDDFLARLAVLQTGGSLAVPNGMAVGFNSGLPSFGPQQLPEFRPSTGAAIVATKEEEAAGETKALRQDLRESQAQLAALLVKLNKVFASWDVDGLPATRTV